ncbi:MAG: hypothetical protein KDK07_07910 [Bauldia sp.]|nr:hypothetical protein [Bauldia sp.]
MRLIPEGRPNHYLDAEAREAGVEHIVVLREGQTVQEFLDERAAEASAEPEPEIVIIPYAAFRARWEPEELAALFEAKKTDWRVEDYVTLASAQNAVNLSSKTTKAAKALLVAAGVLTAERADKIFAAD